MTSSCQKASRFPSAFPPPPGGGPVPDVTLKLGDTPIDTSVSYNDGDFQLTELAGGDRMLVAEKLGDFKNAISSLDASLILQHAVGLTTLGPFQQLACDVTGNGALSSLDASRVLQLRVGPAEPLARRGGLRIGLGLRADPRLGREFRASSISLPLSLVSPASLVKGEISVPWTLRLSVADQGKLRQRDRMDRRSQAAPDRTHRT